jgi:hypothetical protein
VLRRRTAAAAQARSAEAEAKNDEDDQRFFHFVENAKRNKKHRVGGGEELARVALL